MAAPRTDDREQVRMLVLSVGAREAARQAGIPENTVLAWCHRFGWLEHVKPQEIELPASMRGASSAIKPADALQNILSERKLKTRLALSKYVREASHEAAIAPNKLAIANDVKAVAAVMDTLWPEDRKGSGSMTVNLLSISR